MAGVGGVRDSPANSWTDSLRARLSARPLHWLAALSTIRRAQNPLPQSFLAVSSGPTLVLVG